MKPSLVNEFRTVLVVLSLTSIISSAYGQADEEVQTLLDKDTKVSFLWSPGIKFNSIQGDVGSAIEVYGGPVFRKSYLIGLVGGVNFGHPTVNYGYFGLIGQYTYKPNWLIHYGGQVMAAYGSTKDYEHEKTSLFDNFWNVSGTGFWLIEPGANIELNLKTNMRLALGLSYRFVTGLDENSEYVSRTHVTNEDMSGVNIRIGLVFGKLKN